MSVIYQADHHGITYRTELYVGAVIEDREKNYHDDSDFYVVAWDSGLKKVITEEYATTRFGGGGSAHVDATAEVKELVREWCYPKALEILRTSHRRYHSRIQEGSYVRYVKGRKHRERIGRVGLVFYCQEHQYSYSSWGGRSLRLGIRFSDARDENGRWSDVIFTAASNCEIPDELIQLEMPSEEELQRMARAQAYATYRAGTAGGPGLLYLG